MSKPKINSQTHLIINGARENNLQNISLNIPKNTLTVITGVSGSGKSSLAFDTIFAEGQRRYVESLSTYARQFLGQLDKPDIDHIEGLTPAIAIDQKTVHNNPRSTVGTVTEIYDYLRLLYGRIGHQHCPVCKEPVTKQTIDQIIEDIYTQALDQKTLIATTLVNNKKGDQSKLIQRLKIDGFMRVMINNEITDLDSDIKFTKTKKYTIDLIVDRLVIKTESRSRLADSLTLALKKGNGFAHVYTLDTANKIDKKILCSQDLTCPNGHGGLPELDPKLFSFNSPQGACAECHGLGSHNTFTPDKLIPDPKRPLLNCIEPWSKSASNYYVQLLTSVAESYNVSPVTRWCDLSDEMQDAVLYGTDGTIELRYDSYDGSDLLTVDAEWDGVIARLNKKYKQSADKEKIKAQLEEYMHVITCKSCNGTRLQASSNYVLVGNKAIHEITNMDINNAVKWVKSLKKLLKKHELKIVERVIPELINRLTFLLDVGLDYLMLSRVAGSLSGGEAQRIRLATQIGSGLSGILYVLDEPSIGLHQKDNTKLIQTLRHLQNLGNTVIVVEHDEDTMQEADWIVDIGEGAGKYGGHVIAEGNITAIKKNKKSLTGKYLSGKLAIPIKKESEYRPGNGNFLNLYNAHLNNLQNIDITIPLGAMTAVTGVSGSGKSSLIMELLLPYLESKFKRSRQKPKLVDSLDGIEHLDKVIEINQKPIGRTPHSNPATYTGVFTPIRELFASMNEARLKGFEPGHFSFNVKDAGRCEHCKGQGQLEIEMNFLPSVYLTCPVCKGKRFIQEILDVKFKGKSIADVLGMTVSEGVEFFKSIPAVYNKLITLQEVGLDYITLGQSALTLSGGEAQRVKLATELSKRQTGQTIYILDEPTTGLHWHDINKLLIVLNKLTDIGNTVLIIEHNLDIIKQCDWIIDLGPDGGHRGGNIIATGTPHDIIQCEKSWTAKYLKPYIG